MAHPSLHAEASEDAQKQNKTSRVVVDYHFKEESPFISHYKLIDTTST